MADLSRSMLNAAEPLQAHECPTPKLNRLPDVAAAQPLREAFFTRLKTCYPNIYALYHLVSIVCVWSGFWYFADTWATGQDLWAAAVVMPLSIPIRHCVLLGAGILLLVIGNQSLRSLVTMKDEPPSEPLATGPWPLQYWVQWKQQFPDQMALYTLIGIILCWCGTWGLLWDIPVWPWLRSLITIGLGLGMLYLDNLSLDQL